MPTIRVKVDGYAVGPMASERPDNCSSEEGPTGDSDATHARCKAQPQMRCED